MIDVMLVLLILFMVAVPAIERSVRPPRAENASSAPDAARAELVIDRDGVFSIDRKRVNRAQLVAAIQASLATHHDTTLYLRADRSLPYSVILNALDAAAFAGVSHIASVTEPEAAR
jgi:biopolymer transport protein ExbD